MEDIKVKKSELLAKLKENRVKHAADYKESKDGYKQKVIDLFTEKLEKAKAGTLQPNDFMIHLPAVENHDDDYDRAIQMLEMSVNDEINLSSHEFDQYVRDKWQWAQVFAASNTFYKASK